MTTLMMTNPVIHYTHRSRFGLPMWLCVNQSAQSGQQDELAARSDREILQVIQSTARETASQQWEQAFTVLYNRYEQDVIRFMRSKGLPEHEVEQYAAEVWIVVLKKIDRFEWTGASIKTWIFSIAKNKCFEYFDRIKKERLMEVNSEETLEQLLSYIHLEIEHSGDGVDPSANTMQGQGASDVESSILQGISDRLLAEAVETLKPVEQAVIELTHFQGQNATEIGELLGKKPGTIRTIRSRAITKLEKYLTKQQGKQSPTRKDTCFGRIWTRRMV